LDGIVILTAAKKEYYDQAIAFWLKPIFVVAIFRNGLKPHSYSILYFTPFIQLYGIVIYRSVTFPFLSCCKHLKNHMAHHTEQAKKRPKRIALRVFMASHTFLVAPFF